MISRGLLKIIAPLLAACLLTACGPLTSIKGMAPGIDDFGKQNSSTVRVQTEVGSLEGDVSVSGPPENYISNVDFKESVENAITNSKIFKEVTSSAGENYLLTVHITHISIGTTDIFSSLVGIKANWTLIRAEDKKPILEKTIISNGTATFSDTIWGVKRIGLAIEYAVRENIRLGLTAIAATDL